MNKKIINTPKPSLRLTVEMIPRHVQLKLAGTMVMLGILQNLFYSLINISLDDLHLIFDSKNTVTIAFGWVFTYSLLSLFQYIYTNPYHYVSRFPRIKIFYIIAKY